MHAYDEPVYLISVVAKVLNIHPQTLRQYEREGLISPSRTEGKTRLYSQKDIDRIKTILRLTRELGVNLAGVDIILRLKERMEEMEREIERLQAALERYESGAELPKSRAIIKKDFKTDIIIFEEEK
ncbi:MAG: MerR family transcriptional regulator [Nitratiruptor sp.]|nr:MerR family transcriptional regulator [Nitratiruptor sp.]